LFREHRFSIVHDVELRLLARYGTGLEPCRLELGRETRGPFVIAVSDRAKEDLDRHVASLYSRAVATAGRRTVGLSAYPTEAELYRN
jgi:hypothetical protein